METSPPSDVDPSVAFERLSSEVSLLRRAIEGLTAERQSTPDYSPTLDEMNVRLDTFTSWARKVSERPAIQLTPTALAREIAVAGNEVRAGEHRAMVEATSCLTAQTAMMSALVKRDRNARQQAEQLRYFAIGGFAAGILLWSFLPGTVARVLPGSWHMPERIATHVIGSDRWTAGQRMMASADPKRWQTIVDASRDNRSRRPAAR